MLNPRSHEYAITEANKPMTVPKSVIDRLSRAVQPLVFETGIDDAPYSVLGTVFLVSYKSRPYALTTRHSLNPDNLLSPICIFTSDISDSFIPLKDVFYVSKEDYEEDFVDFAVIAVDTSCIDQSVVAQTTLIDLDRASDDWEKLEGEFVMIGFPADHTFVDYDKQIISTDHVALHAQYVARSSIPYLHEIEILESHDLTTFCGFSGSPIFVWCNGQSCSPSLTLCGMALRGTTSSGRVHFLDRSVLIDALRVKIKQEAR